MEDSATADGRYRLLVESINDYAIYMLDTEGKVVNWNAGAQRFKGYTADEIVGRNFSAFYSDEDRAAGIPQRNLARAANEGRFEEEGWRVRKDGSRFWAGVVIDRIVDSAGNLVGFSRRQDLAMGPVDVLDTVRGMTEILDRSLGPSIFVNMRFPTSLPAAHTDRAQLELALLNLAVNARDAMASGGPITIEASRKTVSEADVSTLKSGDYIVLSVMDTGEGMDEPTLNRAAEPFFTTKGVGKGTGLGLSMVHGLAEQSGGRLTLTSRKGQGTRAEIWLPVATQQADVVPSLTPAAAPADRSGRRILVVDDDPLVLLNTVTMAEELGHDVSDAQSGAQALAILEKKQIDLVVTDYAMPELTGGELADMIKARWPGTKILISTGYAEMPSNYKGRFARLPKPFSSDDLQAAIERAL